MANSRINLVFFFNLAILNSVIDYGISKQFRIDDEPVQVINRMERGAADEIKTATENSIITNQTATAKPNGKIETVTTKPIETWQLSTAQPNMTTQITTAKPIDATPGPEADYHYVDFENRRESKWSGTVDPTPTVEARKMSCDGGESEWDNLVSEKSIKFQLDEASCEINILGSKAEKCSAEIVCNDLNFQQPTGDKCQPDSYLKITDSLGGSLTACGDGNFGGPYRPSKSGRDLYIKYKGPSKGTVCQVSCGQDRKIPQYTPLLNVFPRKSEPSCNCGVKPEMQGRTLKRNEAKPFEFPWIAAIAYKATRMQFCGGSLINDRYILTAAHCFHSNGIVPEDIDVLLHAHVLDLSLNEQFKEGAPVGSYGSILEVPGLNERNYTDEDEETLRLEVEQIYLHPLWDFKTFDYDICLLKLKEPLNLQDTSLSNPVCLPPAGKYFGYSNKTVTVAGWGKPHENAGAASRLLQKANMPVLHSKTCRRIFDSETHNMTPRMVCAGHLKGGIDSCVGDSGGPLIFKFNDDQYRQIGIVSFGEGCDRLASPGVYTSVQADAIWCEDVFKPPAATEAIIEETTLEQEPQPTEKPTEEEPQPPEEPIEEEPQPTEKPIEEEPQATEEPIEEPQPTEKPAEEESQPTEEPIEEEPEPSEETTVGPVSLEETTFEPSEEIFDDPDVVVDWQNLAFRKIRRIKYNTTHKPGYVYLRSEGRRNRQPPSNSNFANVNN